MTSTLCLHEVVRLEIEQPRSLHTISTDGYFRNVVITFRDGSTMLIQLFSQDDDIIAAQPEFPK